MDMLEYAYRDIKKYNPYKDLAEFKDSEVFEQKFLEYLDAFNEEHVKVWKEKLGHLYDAELDNFFDKVISKRNNGEIGRILRNHTSLIDGKYDFDNEEEIIKLKKHIRQVKDMILASEPADMKRLQRIDEKVGEVIDTVTDYFNVSFNTDFDGIKIYELMDSFKPRADFSLEEYTSYVSMFKKKIEDICEHYRRNYSVDTATSYIKEFCDATDKFLNEWNVKIGLEFVDKASIRVLLSNASLDFERILSFRRNLSRTVTFSDYDAWIKHFRNKITKHEEGIRIRYTSDVAKKMIDYLNLECGKLIDRIALEVGYPDKHKKMLESIMASYRPEDLYDLDKLGIFDASLYSSDEECSDAYCKYYPILFDMSVLSSDDPKNAIFRRNYAVSREEAIAFETRMYDQYVRMFKGKIRELTSNIRQTYSLKRANRMVGQINKRTDDLICEKAKEMGKQFPKNPCLVRKYLWSDPTNFISESGTRFRQAINPLMRTVVKLFMNNRLVIEERPKFDPTKPFIFVSTHYFTEDVIGLFTSLDRQAYMLMGTTDQIENNPLLLAAILFGYFYVDRKDLVSRKECVDKQNKVLDYSSFINYVGGSRENSENELQPLSFSSPYITTSNYKNVQIIPVASYLSREDNDMYVRYGEPLDLSKCNEQEANDIIRDTLASMHFKQIDKYSEVIDTIYIDGYGETHNLPYNQHVYYMEQVAYEYWNQPWTKPFAVEEIGFGTKKITTMEDAYSFVDNLSREKLIEMSSVLGEPLRRIDEDRRYDIVSYIDRNYDRLRLANDKKTKRKVKK